MFSYALFEVIRFYLVGYDSECFCDSDFGFIVWLGFLNVWLGFLIVWLGFLTLWLGFLTFWPVCLYSERFIIPLTDFPIS